MSPPEPRSYGEACAGGESDPCQYARCGDRHNSILDDLSRAIGCVQDAIVALGASPLGDDTVRSLDWYFNDHSPATADTARERQVCIRDCLSNTWLTDEYGCHPGYGGGLAYVCVESTAACTDRVTPICFADSHFGTSNRVRAQSVIHECAHRVGMSLGRPESEEDIYQAHVALPVPRHLGSVAQQRFLRAVRRLD